MPRTDRLYFLVEGPDDEFFVKYVIAPLFKDKYSKINIQQFQEENKRIKSALIKSFEDSGFDYFLMADMDDQPCVSRKKSKVIDSFGLDIPLHRIVIVVKEIEGWYLSGVDFEHCKKLKIRHLGFTDNICKESFHNLIPSKMLKQEFLMRIVECFDIEEAKRKNKSFKYFFEKAKLP